MRWSTGGSTSEHVTQGLLQTKVPFEFQEFPGVSTLHSSEEKDKLSNVFMQLADTLLTGITAK